MTWVIHIIYIIWIEARGANNLDYIIWIIKATFKPQFQVFQMSLLCWLYGFVTIVTAAIFNPQCEFSLAVIQNVASNWILWLIILNHSKPYSIHNVASALLCWGFLLIGPSFTVTTEAKTHIKSTLDFFFHEASDWTMLDRNKIHNQTTIWFPPLRDPRLYHEDQ